MGSPGLGPRASDPQGKEEATGRAVRRSSPSSSPEGRMHWLGFGSGEAETDNKGPSASPEARMHWLGFGSREAETDNKGPSASLGRSPLNSRRWLVRDAAETKEMDESAEGEKEVSGAFERTTRQRGFMSRFVDASKETRDEDEECEFSQEAEEDNEDTWTRRSVRWQCFCGTTALCWIRTRQEYAAWVRLLGQSLAYWSKAVLLVAVVMYLGFLLQGFLVLCTSFATWRVKEKETYFVRALSFTSLLKVTIAFADLEARFKPATARRAWTMLTTESYLDCKVGAEEIVQGLQRFYFSVLSAASQPQLLANMGSIIHLSLKILVFCLTLIYALWAFGYDIQASLLSILTAFAALSFALSGIIREIVSALAMVLLAQPFQVGDRVRLPGLGPMWQKYWVDRINIMNTLMRDFYGEIHVYPNSLLASQEIINLSRTPHCNVEIILDVSFDTPKAKLKQLFERITSFLKHKRLHWKPKFGMYVYGVSQATTLTLGLWLAHRLNSSSDIVFEDKSEAMDFIRNSMIELGIDWRPKRADLDIHMQTRLQKPGLVRSGSQPELPGNDSD